MKVKPNPGFDPLRAGIGHEEYFVFSRIDGVATLREIVAMSGLAVPRAIEILQKLREVGAVLLPGEVPPPVAPPPKRARTAPVVAPARAATRIGVGDQRQAPAQPASAPGTSPPRPRVDTADLTIPPRVLVLRNPTPEEKTLLAEASDLNPDTRQRILVMARYAQQGDPWGLLGVERTADKRLVKKVYFQLSKDYHPDRFYGRKLGSFAGKLALVFEAINRAYQDLSDGKSRTASAPTEAQSPTQYAADLFAQACDLEISGKPTDALPIFAAVLRIDAQVRYLRRAASCAIAAEQPKMAESYATKAQAKEPGDASISRILASALRAQGRLDEAEDVLVMAMAMPVENDSVIAEVRKDLTEIRRLTRGA
jgi:hypothetical protein